MAFLSFLLSFRLFKASRPRCHGVWEIARVWVASPPARALPVPSGTTTPMWLPRIWHLPPEGPRLGGFMAPAGICLEGGPDPHVSFVWAGLWVLLLVSLPLWPVCTGVSALCSVLPPSRCPLPVRLSPWFLSEMFNQIIVSNFIKKGAKFSPTI